MLLGFAGILRDREGALMPGWKPICPECAKLHRRVKKLERLISMYVTLMYGKDPCADDFSETDRPLLEEAKRVMRRAK